MAQTRNNEITLQDVINQLIALRSAENYGGVLMLAELIIGYFQRPENEIGLNTVKEARRYFPLYLSHLRVPLEHIDPISGELDNLIRVGEDLQSKRHLGKAA